MALYSVAAFPYQECPQHQNIITLCKAIKSGGIYYKVDDKDNRKSLSFKSSHPRFKNTLLFYPNLQKELEKHKEQRVSVAELVKQSLPEKGRIDYIDGWYNTMRIHSTLGDKSPLEMFFT